MSPVIVRWAVVGATDTAAYAFTRRERAKAGAFRFERDRDAYLAAHALVRECAAELSGRDAAGLVLANRCPDCGSEEHGRPYVVGLEACVSLSHTRGYVAAAAAHRPVGVDVEAAGVAVPDEVFAPGELGGGADVRLHRWVLKESLIKVGATRLDELAGVDLSAVGGAGAYEWGGWALRSRAVDGGRAVLGTAGAAG